MRLARPDADIVDFVLCPGRPRPSAMEIDLNSNAPFETQKQGLPRTYISFACRVSISQETSIIEERKIKMPRRLRFGRGRRASVFEPSPEDTNDQPPRRPDGEPAWVHLRAQRLARDPAGLPPRRRTRTLPNAPRFAGAARAG